MHDLRRREVVEFFEDDVCVPILPPGAMVCVQAWGKVRNCGRSRNLLVEQGRFSLVEQENEKEKKTVHSATEVLDAGISLGLSLFGGGGSKHEEEEFERRRGMHR